MKTILFTLLLVPTVATAQDLVGELEYPETDLGYQPSYPIAVQPILPVPRDRGPWGTGYSVVTTTRERRDPFAILSGDTNGTKTETVQRVVPNDWSGAPIRGLDLGQ